MFEGLYTAVVTPFNSKGQVDYERLRTLIELQIAAGVDGIVPVGTTGESPTVDFDEHNEIIRVSVEACRKRVKVIAGTGANATKEALKLTRYAKEIGADGSLQVAPYYNRPNQEGLYRHFSEAMVYSRFAQGGLTHPAQLFQGSFRVTATHCRYFSQ